MEEHLEGKPEAVAATFHAYTEAIRACGPVTLRPTKTRIGYVARTTFAEARVRTKWVDGDLVLRRRIDSPRIRRHGVLGMRHVHSFRMCSPEDVDSEVRSWIREAYLAGSGEEG